MPARRGPGRHLGATLISKEILFVRGTKTDAADRELTLIPAAKSIAGRARRHREGRRYGYLWTAGHTLLPPARLPRREAESLLLGPAPWSWLAGPDPSTTSETPSRRAASRDRRWTIPTVARRGSGHKDGGALLVKTWYFHYRRPHSIAQAAKVTVGM